MLDVVSGFFSLLEPALLEAGIPKAQFAEGLEAIKLGAAQLALEVAQAENLRVPLSRAVRDPERFPRLVQVHNSIQDLLALELPEELLRFVRHIAAMSVAPQVEGLLADLARIAALKEGPLNALARFALFECVRLNVLVVTWSEKPELMELGIDDKVIDRLAERNMRPLLENPDDLQGPEPVRPMAILVLSTALEVDQHREVAKQALSRITAELREIFERRRKLEEAFQDMDSRDAVLLRNHFGPVYEEQRIEIKRLKAQHPLIFADERVNTLDKRLSRRLAEAKKDGLAALPVRRKPALIDIFMRILKETAA